MKTNVDTSDRTKARLKIIQAANGLVRRKHMYGVRLPGRLYGPRQIQQAVCVARRHRLVKPEVLVTAGFRATAR